MILVNMARGAFALPGFLLPKFKLADAIVARTCFAANSVLLARACRAKRGYRFEPEEQLVIAGRARPRDFPCK